MVEEVVGAGFEGIGVEEPAAVGYLNAKLVLFVALAVERCEAGVGGLRVLDERAGGGKQRRGLVEAAVEAAEDPVEFGDADGCAEAGVGLVLGEHALEVGLAETGDQGEPGGGFVVVGDVLFDDSAVS